MYEIFNQQEEIEEVWHAAPWQCDWEEEEEETQWIREIYKLFRSAQVNVEHLPAGCDPTAPAWGFESRSKLGRLGFDVIHNSDDNTLLLYYMHQLCDFAELEVVMAITDKNAIGVTENFECLYKDHPRWSHIARVIGLKKKRA